MVAPAVPQGFLAQQGNGQVFLSWGIVAGATSYKVQRSTDGVSYSNLAAPVLNQYLDTNVFVGVRYFYQVAASNGTDSPYTAPLMVIPAESGAMSLWQLRTMAQQRADRVNSNFVTTGEWNMFINQACFELYDLLVTAYEDMFLAPALTFSTNGVDQFYPLPDGTNYDGAAPFYKLMGVDLGLNGTQNALVTLRKFDFIERNRYVYPNNSGTLLGVFNMRYRVLGDKIEFIPQPAAGQMVKLWYIPRMKQLLQDTDILDGFSGWTQYPIIRAAKYALDKEESDTSKLDEELAFLKSRIEETAMNRDVGSPDTISNTRGFSGSSGVMGNPGWGDSSSGGW